jgi:hypothetical protein
MEFVQRIMSKVVGQEISEAELELIAGGLKDPCTTGGGYHTVSEYGGLGECDFK